MCGIVGYIGQLDAKEILLKGLEKLEYRGYDSAGIAVANEQGVHVYKEKAASPTFVKWWITRLNLKRESAIHAGRLTANQAS